MTESTENINQLTLQNLVKDITNRNKRENFLQACGALKPADELLLLMQEKVFALIPTSEVLRQLFLWVHRKATLVEGGHNSIPVHTLYFALIRVLYLSINRTFDSAQGLTGAKFREFVKNFDKAYSFTNNCSDTLTLNYSMGENPIYVLSCIFASDFEPELRELLLETHSQIASMQSDIEEFKHWRQVNGKNYINTFRSILGFNINFTEKDKELLKNYYYIYDLLLSCLHNKNCEVTESVKTHIENNLLRLFSLGGAISS